MTTPSEERSQRLRLKCRKTDIFSVGGEPSSKIFNLVAPIMNCTIYAPKQIPKHRRLGSYLVCVGLVISW